MQKPCFKDDMIKRRQIKIQSWTLIPKSVGILHDVASKLGPRYLERATEQLQEMEIKYITYQILLSKHSLVPTAKHISFLGSKGKERERTSPLWSGGR